MSDCEAVVSQRIGIMGAGKTLSAVHYLVTQFLPWEDERMHYWTNIPIDPEACARFAAKISKKPWESYVERIHIIPDDVLEAWKCHRDENDHAYYLDEDNTGPFDYFAEKEYLHICLDEATNYCGEDTPREVQHKYKVWCTLLRKRFSRFETIAQDDSLLSAQVAKVAGTRYRVWPDNRYDPILGIPYHDWWQLKAKFITGRYIGRSWYVEESRLGRGWDPLHKPIPFWRSPDLFTLYRSYDSAEDQRPGERVKQLEWERRSKLGLLWAVGSKSSSSILRQGALWGFIFYFFLFGGWRWLPYIGKSLHADVMAKRERITADAKVEKTVPNVKVTKASTQAKPVAIAAVEVEGEVKQPVTTEAKREDATSDWAVVAMQPDAVTFANGLTVKLREEVIFGEFKGKHLESINYEQGTARISDVDRIFGISRVFAARPVTSGTASDSVRGDLRGSNSQPDRDVGDNVRGHDHPARSRPSTSRLSSAPRASNAGVNRDVSQSGRAIDNDGAAASTGINSSRPGGSPLRR